MSAASSAIPPAVSSSSPSERLPVMSRHGVRDLLRFIGAALLTGLVASLLLMAAILFLTGQMPDVR